MGHISLRLDFAMIPLSLRLYRPSMRIGNEVYLANILNAYSTFIGFFRGKYTTILRSGFKSRQEGVNFYNNLIEDSCYSLITTLAQL